MVLTAILAAILYTVFVWWFSTGAILWLNRQRASTYAWSLLATSVLAIVSAFGLVASMRDASPAGAFLAFTCAIGIWAWHELSFLTGIVSGPRTAACPPNAAGWRRFALAASTVVYHEIALAITAGAIVAISWGQPNQIGAWVFSILFVSRLSAKLNLFFGVPSFSDEFFPKRLKYLSSYIRRGPVSPLFPWSIAAGACLAGMEAWAGLSPLATTFQSVGFALMFTLTGLALVEHAFMVVRLNDAALWRWAMPAKRPNAVVGRDII